MALIPSQVLRVAILLSYFSILCHYKALDMPAHQTYGGSWKFLTFIDLVRHFLIFSHLSMRRAVRRARCCCRLSAPCCDPSIRFLQLCAVFVRLEGTGRGAGWTGTEPYGGDSHRNGSAVALEATTLVHGEQSLG